MYNHLKTALLAGFALGTGALAGESDKKIIVPVPEESWQFKLSLPGWIPWIEGTMGLNGYNSNISLNPNVTVPKIDMVADLRAEAHKGRWSVMGEFLYMS